MRDIININEINEDLWDAAVSEANDIDRSYRDSGQGISSSDMGVFTRDMLSEVGIKFRLVGSKFERIMADGGTMQDRIKKNWDNLQQKPMSKYKSLGVTKKMADKGKMADVDRIKKNWDNLQQKPMSKYN